LQLAPAEAASFDAGAVPERVANYEEYVAFRNEVRDIFRTSLRLLPGSIVGARPIEVRSKGSIGDLNTKKLKEGIDFIAAGFSWIVSERVAQVIQECNARVPLGSVVFHTGDREFRGYHVIELEPRPIWTQSERAKYELSVCERCGSSYKKSPKGTFAMKQFDGSCFSDGFVLIRGAESRNLFMNEPLYQRLIQLKPKGVSFTKAGEWA